MVSVTDNQGLQRKILEEFFSVKGPKKRKVSFIVEVMRKQDFLRNVKVDGM